MYYDSICHAPYGIICSANVKCPKLLQTTDVFLLLFYYFFSSARLCFLRLMPLKILLAARLTCAYRKAPSPLCCVDFTGR